MKKLLLVPLLFITSFANAENCWMTGSCLNQVGYIVLPESHFKYKEGDTGTINGKPFIVDASLKILKENGLPDINSVATINTNYYELLGTYKFDRDIEAISEYFKKKKDFAFKWNTNKTEAKLVLNLTQFSAGNQMADGTKVKILGYRLLKEVLPEVTGSHILALIQVVEEPK